MVCFSGTLATGSDCAFLAPAGGLTTVGDDTVTAALESDGITVVVAAAATVVLAACTVDGHAAVVAAVEHDDDTKTETGCGFGVTGAAVTGFTGRCTEAVVAGAIDFAVDDGVDGCCCFSGLGLGFGVADAIGCAAVDCLELVVAGAMALFG